VEARMLFVPVVGIDGRLLDERIELLPGQHGHEWQA
jgi:hypothetical protein